MNHKSKVKIARRLLTGEERKGNTSVFDSVGWKVRKEAIAERVKNQQGKAHERALERQKKWAKNYDFCIKCGTNDRPHHGRGLCTSCREEERIYVEKQEYDYSTVHISCEVCGKLKDTGIALKKQKKGIHESLEAKDCLIIKKLQETFKKSHEEYGYC